MITQKELDSVSTMGAFDRYRYFIKKIADFGEIYFLKDQENNLAVSEIDDNLLLSFWSAEEFTKSCLSGVWKDYSIRSISLEEFENILLPIIRSNNYLIDVFPVNNKAGFVVSLEEFINDLNIELSNYE